MPVACTFVLVIVTIVGRGIKIKLKMNLPNNLENSNSCWKPRKELVCVDQVLIIFEYLPESIWKKNLRHLLRFFD